MRWGKYILWGMLSSQFIGGVVCLANESTPKRENEKIVRISPLAASVKLPNTSDAMIIPKVVMDTPHPSEKATASANTNPLKKKEINLERKSIWDTYTTDLPNKHEHEGIKQYDIPILAGSGLDNLPGFQTNRPDNNGSVIRAKVKTHFTM